MNGTILALIAALCWAIEAVLVRRGGFDLDPILGTAVGCIASGIIFSLYLFLNGNFQEIMTNRSAVIDFALAGIISFAIGHSFYYLAIRYVNISRAVPIAASYPLIAVILSFLIFREPLTLQSISGIVLIVIGGCLLLI